MALSEKHLTDGEHVEMELRTHVKALFWPLVLLVVLIAAVVAGFVVLPVLAARIVAGGGIVAVVVWVLPPFVRWRSTRYVVTNKRVLLRSGIVTKVGRDIPLYRVNDISTEKGPLDRLFGCGTIVVADATEKPGLVLRDVPDVENVQVKLHDLLFTADDGSDDGEFPPGEPRRPGSTRR
jgi:membrane protein YdbS with pleckstrin-like domain